MGMEKSSAHPASSKVKGQYTFNEWLNGNEANLGTVLRKMACDLELMKFSLRERVNPGCGQTELRFIE